MIRPRPGQVNESGQMNRAGFCVPGVSGMLARL